MRWLIYIAIGAALAMLVRFLVNRATRLPSLENRPVSHALKDTADTALGRGVAAEAAAHPGCSGFHMLLRADDAFAARALLARSAERSIDAQYYIWHQDLTGTLLFEELRRAADRGVRVRLLIDDNTTAGMDATLCALDAHPNIEVRLFNPFMIRSPRLLGYVTDFARLNRRMHNKSFTVDNQATIIGGRNIGDEYFGASDGTLFSDLDVLAVGPIVRDVSSDFDRYWASASAYPLDRVLRGRCGDPARIAARAAAAEADPRSRAYLEAMEELPFVSQLLEARLPFVWATAKMLSDDPLKALGRATRRQLVVRHLDEALESPDKWLGLVSGYFVPTKAGVASFAALARRGVRVAILTNSLEATDVPIVHAGYAKRRKMLLEAGIQLWETRRTAVGRLQPRWRRRLANNPLRRGSGGAGGGSGGSGSVPQNVGQALHAKTFTVDGEALYIGSFNFDPRSAHLNTELGFLIHSRELAGALDDAFARAIPESAYEVRLAGGRLLWVEHDSGRVHEHEPGSNLARRAAVALLSRLPIEWLL